MKFRTCSTLAWIASVGAFLAACNGPQQSGPSPFVQSVEGDASVRAPKSWIRAGAAQKNLLYVMSPFNESVYILTYPQMKLAGVIGQYGLRINTQGMCGDPKGNVFLTLVKPQETAEYRHGGTKPIAALKLPSLSAYAENCAYDPTTGNLAVAYAGPGIAGVAIYANETGTPITYDDPYATNLLWCGYDDKGDLFIDGQGAQNASLSELPRGARSISNVTINETISNPGSVQWDGEHMTLFSQEETGDTALFRLKISGSAATVIGTTQLGNHIGGEWSYIVGNRVTVGNQARNAVQLFKYPTGGDPLKSVPAYDASGVTVSLAPKK